MPLRLLLVGFVMLTVLGIALLLLEDGPGSGADSSVGGTVMVDTTGPALPGAGAIPGGDDGAQPALLVPVGGPGTEPVQEGLEEVGGVLADGTVTGRVVDPQGAPLAGVPVLLYVAEDPWQEALDGETLLQKLGATRTDSEGSFQLPARSGASHTLLAGGVAWARVRLLDVAASDELIVRLEDPRWIEGVVQDEETGEPVAGARVLVLAGAESLTGTTDDDGAFRLAPLAFESVIVAAWAPGHDVGFVTDALTGWEPVVVELPPGRDLIGTVFERETSVPVPGAELRFRMKLAARLAVEEQIELETTEEIVFEQTVVADDQGAFLVEGMPSSGFEVDVTAEGFVPRTLQHWVDRPLQPDEELDVPMRPLEELSGRVVLGVDQVRVPGVPVELSTEGGTLARTVADAAGEFTFGVDGGGDGDDGDGDGLRDWDGSAKLFVSATGPDDTSGRTRVRMRSDDDEELLIRLAEPIALRVSVVAGERPVAGAQVAVQSGSGPDQRTLVTTGPDGMAELVHPRSSPDVDHLFLQARSAGQPSLPVEVDLTDGPPTEPIVLDVEQGSWVEGVVMDAFGAPIPAANVWARGAVGVHSDFSGRFRLGPFEDGRRLKVSASADGFREVSEVVPEVAPWMGGLTLTLEPIIVWKGRVTDSTTGVPVDDYLVQLEREERDDAGPVFLDTRARVERTPGEPGAFAAELPDAGRYRLKVLSREFVDTTSDVLLFDGVTEPLPVDVFLSPAAVLHVKVLDSLGRAVPGFSVRVVDFGMSEDPKRLKKARKLAASRRTDSAGAVRFNLGEGGVYRLTSGSTGWLDADQLRVTPGPPVERTCHLPATGDLSLTLIDEAGEPVERPRVTVRARGRDRLYEVMRRSTPRDAPEEVVIDVLPSGEYQVQVRARGFDTLETSAVVLANRVARERLVLRPAGTTPAPAGRAAGGGDRKRGGGRR